MSAVIEIGVSRAYLFDDRWEWITEDPAYHDILNSLLDPDGPETSDPHPAETEAKKAIELLGGSIVELKPPVRESGVIY